MANKPYAVITFYSMHQAFKLESRAKSSGIGLTLMPVPREISSSCGIASKIDRNDLEKIELIMDEHGIEYDTIYLYEAANSKPQKIKSSDEN